MTGTRTPLQILLCQTLAVCLLGWTILPCHPFVVLAVYIIVGTALLWWGNRESRVYWRHRHIEELRAEQQRQIDQLLGASRDRDT